MAVTFDAVVVDADNAFPALHAGILANVLAAAAEWGAWLRGSARLSIEVRIEETPSNRAQGSAETTAFVRTTGGNDVYEPGSVAELRSGTDPNGATADLLIWLDPDYIAEELWFDPAAGTPGVEPPSEYTDAFSVFLHELGHGLGFNGWRDADGSLPGNYLSPFDAYLVPGAGGLLFFEGPATQAIHGGPLPMTRDNQTHYGNVVGEGEELAGTGLMNGVWFNRGERYAISLLDLAVLADCGVPLAARFGTPGADALMEDGTCVLLASGGGDDTVSGGAGNETIEAGEGNDLANGGPGDDVVRGGAGDDVLYGNSPGAPAGTDNDTLDGGDGDDQLSGFDGDDMLLGGGGSDFINGGAGHDWIDAGPGEMDVVFGGDGDDTILGGDGTDGLLGEAGADSISGDAGNDGLVGGAGNDTLSGGDGDDLLYGDAFGVAAGDDLLFGDAGSDGLVGFDGADTLDGGTGSDGIDGGAGNDVITGGPGDDLILGGSGADRFVFAAGFGRDELRDFSPAEGDRLVFAPAIFATPAAALAAASAYAVGTVITAGADLVYLSATPFGTLTTAHVLIG